MADTQSGTLLPPKPLILQGNLPENFRRFKQRFNLYLLASGNSTKADNIKNAILLHVIGDEALEIYNTLTVTQRNNAEGEPIDINTEDILLAFENYCNPRRNVVYERYKFFIIKQTEGQPIDEYITKLKTQAKHCEFGNQSNLLIRDRIVCGVIDSQLSERFLREKPENLTLERVSEMARASEISKEQIKSLRNDQMKTQTISVNEIKRNKSDVRKKTWDCWKCSTNHGYRQCPAHGYKCKTCSENNHYEKNCPMNKHSNNKPKITQQVAQVDLNDENENDDETCEYFIGPRSHFIGTLGDKDEIYSWYESINISGKVIKFKLDSGAQANVISYVDIIMLFGDEIKMHTTDAYLTAFGGNRLKPIGYTFIHIYGEMLKFFVVNEQVTPTLGLKACEKLRLIQRNPTINKEINIVMNEDNMIKDLIGQYDDIFNGLGKMPGKCHIDVKESVPPVVHAARKVPYSMKNKLKVELDRLEQMEVIEKVTHPTDWVNNLVVIEKSNGNIRVCLDPGDLNKAIRRPHHRAPTGREIADKLANEKLFSVFDLTQAYHQIELDDESSDLCCFNTTYGRYKYLRLPFGINCASDIFQAKNEHIFGHIEGVEVISDELLLHTDGDHIKHLNLIESVFRAARANGVTLNKEKIQAMKTSVKYMGDIFTDKGIQADPDKIQAITEMPSPKSKKDLKRFLGMVNYIGHFVPNLSQITQPLRSLLKNDSVWLWDTACDQAFSKLKQILTGSDILSYYDPEKPTKLQVDASMNGLGACLLQEGKPVAYRSRSLTQAERNYSNIERELLAIVWGCEVLHNFTYGRYFTVQTDHKPLVTIMNKPMFKVSPRLRRLAFRLYGYTFNIEYLPGSKMIIADTLSRASNDVSNTSVNKTDVGDLSIHSIIHCPVSDKRISSLQESTTNDVQLQLLRRYINFGFPDHRKEIREEVKPFWDVRNELSYIDGLITYGDRIVVPLILQKEILELLHSCHLGIAKTRARANEIIYWPGMSTQIENIIGKCETCNKFRNSNQREPLIQHEIPQLPWQKLGMDILTFGGRDYLLIVDYLSKYPELAPMKNKTSSCVIEILKAQFARHGIPRDVIADNVPFNSTECKNFAREWNFNIIPSSPRYPASNGLAERNVQTVKNFLRKSLESGSDIYNALMEFRNTPISGIKYSPAQILMSRRLRTKLPSLQSQLYPKIVENPQQILKEKQKPEKEVFDKQAKHLPALLPGDIIRMQHGKQGVRWTPAIVKDVHHSPRSYLVESEDGTTYRRNRRHLLKTKETKFMPYVPERCEYDIEKNQNSDNDRSHNNIPVIVNNGTDNHNNIPVIVNNGTDNQSNARDIPTEVESTSTNEPTIRNRPIRARKAPLYYGYSDKDM